MQTGRWCPVKTSPYIGIPPENTKEGFCLARRPCLQIVPICTFQLAIWPGVKPDDEADSA
jgi:hypothetical protein